MDVSYRKCHRISRCEIEETLINMKVVREKQNIKMKERQERRKSEDLKESNKRSWKDKKQVCQFLIELPEDCRWNGDRCGHIIYRRIILDIIYRKLYGRVIMEVWFLRRERLYERDVLVSVKNQLKTTRRRENYLLRLNREDLQ